MLNTVARIQRMKPSEPPPSIDFSGFIHGLNTVEEGSALKKTELASCLNYYLSKTGSLVPRPGLKKFSTSAVDGTPYYSVPFKISGALYDIVSTSAFKIYKISSLGVVTLIGAVEGLATMFVFKDTCAVCDGSYIKYIDSAGTLVMSYDAGSESGLYDKLDAVTTHSIKIHSGQERAGLKFTFPTYTGGFKVPIVQVKASVKKTGSPTGSLVAKLYSDTTVFATSTESIDVSTLLSTAQTVYFNFAVDNTVQTGWMASNTSYRVVLIYTSGDTSNCVELLQIDDSTNVGTNYTNAWVDSLKAPLMFVSPSLPPKAKFGRVALNRPFFGGGTGIEGLVYYGNYSIKDFSTPNGGGYIGIIDDNESTYPAAGFGTVYGELYVFGTEAGLYLSKITGAEPDDFACTDTYRNISAEGRTIVSTTNDIWFAKKSGAENLKGVAEYGDLRSFSQAENILDRFDTYWGTSSCAGFFRELNLYLLQLSNYDRVLVCHTALPYSRSNIETDIGYPWTEFSFPYDATMFNQGASSFLIGLADSYIYKFDFSELKDGSADIEFNWRTAFQVTPFNHIDLEQLRFLASSEYGLGSILNIYTDLNSAAPVQSFYVGIAQDGLLVEDADILVEDADILLDITLNMPLYPLNIHCWGVQIECDGLSRASSILSVSGCIIQYKILET